jgi:omega-hydroxy-beta-dihydromenaquinone-9 sulfotransferase
VSTSSQVVQTARHRAEPPRERSLKVWMGAGVGAWLGLLRQNRWAVDPSYLPWAVLISLLAARNTMLGALQDSLWSPRVRRTEVADAPLFIIGHWRSGTTLLHELLALDPRHTYPTTYACAFPSHFLLSERYMARLSRFALPSRRPLDAVPVGWERPQEDEFALCNLGLPSPYLSFAFPNHPPQGQDYFDLDRVPPAARERWKHGLLRFLKQVTLRRPGRLVLKSPTHTCRIRILLELFPSARFVHIVRDPYAVLPSTLRAWATLNRVLGLQRPRGGGLDAHVFANFTRLFDTLEQTRALVAPSRFHELRYEDLARDPIGQVRAIYERLDLGEAAPVLPRLTRYVEETAGYRTNRHEVSSALRDAITERARHVISRYGYAAARADHP